MANRWQALWERKALEGEAPSLARLISMVGWKTLDGDLSEAQWLEFVAFVEARLGIGEGDRLLEVGCGPGGFLLPWYERGFAVAGLDYSESLVEICRQVMPKGRFAYAEAAQIPFEDAAFDVILSNSVCHYFPDLAYMERVLGEIARCLVPGGRGAILDANDQARTAAFMEHRYERFGGREAYERENEGLGQLFYDKDWLLAAGMRVGLEGHIEDQCIDWYRCTPYRFNYFFRRI